MAELRDVMVRMPEGMLQKIDRIAASEKQSRSEFMCDAVDVYIAGCCPGTALEDMKRGYEEMADINLSLAEEGLRAEMAGRD